MSKNKNRYSLLIEKIFIDKFKKGMTEISFEREDLIKFAKKLGIDLPKNLGDVIYSFRYRASLPESILKTAPKGLEWVIRPVGSAKYMFSLSDRPIIIPSEVLSETKIPDATPGLIKMYSLTDEQGLLARLRYNRLIDIFTGIACYSLQSHLRTHVPEMGQIETDEIYVGIDKKGVHYIIPVQAKAGSDKLSIVQIEQDMAMCRIKFGNLICLPIAAQFIENDFIAMFSFESGERGVSVSSEKHYRLVEPDELKPDDLRVYQSRIE